MTNPALSRAHPGAGLALLTAAILAWTPPTLLGQEDREAVRRVYDTVRKSFFTIDISLRKKTKLEKADAEDDPVDADAQRLQQLVDTEQSLEAWGVALEKNRILIADRGLKASDIEKIEAMDWTGGRFEVTLGAVGRNYDFVLLEPAAPREFEALAFADWQRPALGETFHVTFADRVDHRWHLNVSPYILTNAPLVDTPEWFCIDPMRTGSVVSDKKGATVGIALDQYLWAEPGGRSSFLGKGILGDERIADLEALYAPLRKSVASVVKRVEITFRAEKQDERYVPDETSKPGRETVFGVALDQKGTLFVPELITRDQARKIEDIRVGEEGQTVPGTFLGSFRSFGAFLIRAEGLATTPGVDLGAKPVPTGQLFFTATLDDRFARTRVNLDYNRLFRTERGLGGHPRLEPRKKIKPGSFLLDFAGRIIGCATSDKKEEDLDDVAIEGSRERYFMERYRASAAADNLRRVIFFAEIADVLAKPASQFDPKAVPMTKLEEKRLVWLGVDFQEMTKGIAECLGIQDKDLTNDGRRGLIVTDIYGQSPAARAGLRPDDILLTVQPEGETARDLAAEFDRYAALSAMGRSGRLGDRPSAPPWKPTRNYLTSMLTEIGAAKKVAFEVLRGKEKRKVSLTLEYAPTDYETAEKWKDEALGFTVKNLTYEVRQFYKLDPDAAGIVVARVESGSRADVAKLQPLSIISRVNDVAVRDVSQFRELVAHSKGLTLTTVTFGQTKLVELGRE
jgi:hypothetical protein